MVKLYYCKATLTYQGWFGEKTDFKSAYFAFPASLSDEECLDQCSDKTKNLFFKATKCNGITMSTELVQLLEGRGLAIWTSYNC